MLSSASNTTAFTDPSFLAFAAAILLVAVVLAARWLGIPWAKTQQDPVEARAEQSWRSEAAAAKARADRFEAEMHELRAAVALERTKNETIIAELRAQIDVLTARPDMTEVLEKMDQHHADMLDMNKQVADGLHSAADILGRIATAVIPPEHPIDD